jgi:hypothetical protein
MKAVGMSVAKITVLGLTTAMAILAAAPAAAQATLEKPECNKGNITSTEEKIAKMKDGEQKRTASTEIGAAKELLAKGKIEDCQAHLLKAAVQTK